MKIESPLFALTSLARTQQALDRALKQLSSGSRINSASDDPAGLGIATGLEAQIRGINQGTLNINQAFGFLSTAEGSISTQTQIVQRMRELAVNAATGTLSKTDRGYLNTEFQQLLAEFDRIAEQSNFNGSNLLDGTFTTTSVQVGSEASEAIPFSLNSTLSNAAFSSSVRTMLTSQPSGTFQAQSTFGTGSGPTSVSSADLNGDGKADLIVGDFASNQISVLLGNGDGTFKAQTTYATGSFPETVTSVDVNGDNKLDLLVANNGDNTISVFIGNGNGTFQAQTTFAGGNGPISLTTADVNGDGKQDVILANETDNTVSVLLGNGNGTFQAESTFAIGNLPFSVATTDVNGDGKADIVAVNEGDNTVSVLIGNGNGTFKAQATYAVGSSPESMTTADVNGDGKADLIVANISDNTVSILLGNGNGTFQAQSTYATGAFPQSVTAGDINGDGKIDLIASNVGDNTVSVLLGNGNGTFKSQATYAMGNSPYAVITKDVNGDGAPDIITANQGSNNASVLLGKLQTATIPLDISTQSDASNILSVLDSGLTYLSSQRSSIGAYQSRLESALSVNQITSENLSNARSQIMDTDVASATSELVKDQILQQAGVSVLAQANFSNQLLLKLLNF